MAGGLVRAVLSLLLAHANSQQEPVRPTDWSGYVDDLHWEDIASWRDIPWNAVWCGYQYPNEDTARRERSYVARVYRGNSLVPGKATYWGASAANFNSTFSGIPNFEVAVAHPHRVQWVAAAVGAVPPGSVVAGLTREGQPLYACRFHFDRRMSMACGAVQRYTERCVAEMDGSLVSSPVYEVLTASYITYITSIPPPLPTPMVPPRDDVDIPPRTRQ